MQRLLRIAVWNANGLPQHLHEIKTYLIDKDIDVFLISESHLTDRNYLKIPKYSIYHTTHPENKARGGSAVIIKNSIKHHELAKFSTKKIQATGIVVEDWNGPFAIYCPPNLNIQKEDFQEYFDTIGQRFIVGGDFNAKHPHWGSRLTNPRGRQLHQVMQNSNLLHTISTGHSTYWPSDNSKNPDLLDFCITKGFSSNYLSIQSSLELSSDHTPIEVTLSVDAKKT